MLQHLACQPNQALGAGGARRANHQGLVLGPAARRQWDCLRWLRKRAVEPGGIDHALTFGVQADGSVGQHKVDRFDQPPRALPLYRPEGGHRQTQCLASQEKQPTMLRILGRDGNRPNLAQALRLQRARNLRHTACELFVGNTGARSSQGQRAGAGCSMAREPVKRHRRHRRHWRHHGGSYAAGILGSVHAECKGG